MSSPELEKELGELKTELFKLKFSLATNGLDNPMKIKETKKDTTKHAEMIAIQKASKKLDSWRLLDCEMYVTLEPCSMCAGAMIQARLKKVYIGTMDEKTGACGSVLNLPKDYKFNHIVEIEYGILAIPMFFSHLFFLLQ